ncbi:MAG: hypothetical protein ACR2MA_01335 [Egibacteraceae bacterium]
MTGTTTGAEAPLRMSALRRAVLLTVAALLALATFAMPAGAQEADEQDVYPPAGARVFIGVIGPVPHTAIESAVSGSYVVTLEGTTLQISLSAFGATPNLPHAMHIHTGSACPAAGADADGDGLISVVEGIPSYGAIRVPLTVTGPTGPESALALDRMPVANAAGAIFYRRTIEIPAEFAANFGAPHVVVHGFDGLNATPGYQTPPVSPLGPVPQEATLPVGCGEAAEL